MRKISSKNRAGFILIEILVVVSIMALLAAVILASLQTARNKAKETKMVSDMKQVILATELYRLDYGVYPASGSSLSLLVPTYLSSEPFNPFVSSALYYLRREEEEVAGGGGGGQNLEVFLKCGEEDGDLGRLFVYTTVVNPQLSGKKVYVRFSQTNYAPYSDLYCYEGQAENATPSGGGNPLLL